jgi:hypothetical protein
MLFNLGGVGHRTNVSYRVCGRFVDREPSRIMLSSDIASELPNIKGRFIVKDDGFSEVQSFYFSGSNHIPQRPKAELPLLDMIIKEYISIVEALAEDEPIENGRIIIDRESFKAILEKYGYMTFSQKTKAYKALNFIIHDKNNYTMPCKNPALNKTVRRVVINYSTYKTVKNLYETTVNL